MSAVSLKATITGMDTASAVVSLNQHRWSVRPEYAGPLPHMKTIPANRNVSGDYSITLSRLTWGYLRGAYGVQFSMTTGPSRTFSDARSAKMHRLLAGSK
jgi:hypothetical protein